MVAGDGVQILERVDMTLQARTIASSVVRPAAAALIMLLSATTALAGALEDGVAAYERGDFATAARLWKQSADEGNAAAQNNLGILYDLGKGVARSDKKALEWFQKSADQGYARAQFNLGRKYDNGEGTERDPVAAYMWFLLAAAGGAEAFAHTRNKIAKTLTPEQRDQAKARARAWLEQRTQ